MSIQHVHAPHLEQQERYVTCTQPVHYAYQLETKISNNSLEALILKSIGMCVCVAKKQKKQDEECMKNVSLEACVPALSPADNWLALLQIVEFHVDVALVVVVVHSSLHRAVDALTHSLY